MLREALLAVALGAPVGVGVSQVVATDAPSIPARAVGYYKAGAESAPCPMDWRHLAGIGWIETRHGTWQGATIQPDGEVTPHIWGPQLDGRSAAIGLIRDTDGGAIDEDDVFDRGGGPMAFIPQAWEVFGRDVNGDGRAHIHNFADAMGAAAALLCHNGYDAGDPAATRLAIRRYNGSGPAAEDYASKVTAYVAELGGGYVSTGSPSGDTPVGERSFVAAIDRKAVEGWMTLGGATADVPEAHELWAVADEWLFATVPGPSAPDDPPPPVGGVPQVQTDRVDPVFAARVAAMRAERPGITVNNDFRSVELQRQLFTAAVARYGSEAAARKWVAPPGRSNHGRGLAADLAFASTSDRTWAHANVARFGLCFPMSWEPWHVQPVETCDGTIGS